MGWNPGPSRTLTRAEQESLNRQAEMLKVLVKLPTADAIGVACSLLLVASEREPAVVRRVLNEQVVKEGFRGTSLLTVLRRVAQ